MSSQRFQFTIQLGRTNNYQIYYNFKRNQHTSHIFSERIKSIIVCKIVSSIRPCNSVDCTDVIIILDGIRVFDRRRSSLRFRFVVSYSGPGLS